ncbi:MAG: hypothetical protein JXM69_14235 [Anaerolineae bacterium]|nr:hypothetical protein [Anaerolineae bacterium]
MRPAKEDIKTSTEMDTLSTLNYCSLLIDTQLFVAKRKGNTFYVKELYEMRAVLRELIDSLETKN